MTVSLRGGRGAMPFIASPSPMPSIGCRLRVPAAALRESKVMSSSKCKWLLTARSLACTRIASQAWTVMWRVVSLAVRLCLDPTCKLCLWFWLEQQRHHLSIVPGTKHNCTTLGTSRVSGWLVTLLLCWTEPCMCPSPLERCVPNEMCMYEPFWPFLTGPLLVSLFHRSRLHNIH